MQTRAFHRSAQLATAMATIFAKHTRGSIEANAAIGELGGYYSRGKSGKSPRRHGHAHMANVRAARKAHNIAKRK